MPRPSMRELLAKDLAIMQIRQGDEWGMDRNDGIGGSEAGSVLGLNKYHSAMDLLQEKVTRTQLREFTEAQQLRLDVGHAQEALVLKTFARRELDLGYTTSLEDLDHTDMLAHPSSYLFVNPRFKFAFAHVDGLYRLGDEIGIADAKTSFRDPWSEVPEYYIAQLAHYSAILGCNVGYIAAMFQAPPYPTPIEYRFDFTPDQLRLVMAAEAIFWKCVTDIRAGISVSEKELAALESRLSTLGEEFISGIDTSATQASEGAETITVTDRDVELLLRYQELKSQSRLLYAEIDAIAENLNRRADSPNVSFVAPDGTELAKKTSLSTRDLDRGAMVEAGIPIEEFFAATSKSRLTTTKALAKLSSPAQQPSAAARGMGMR